MSTQEMILIQKLFNALKARGEEVRAQSTTDLSLTDLAKGNGWLECSNFVLEELSKHMAST